MPTATTSNGHEIIDWEFDVRSFPKTASELGRVIKDAQSLQHAIAAAFGYQG